MVIIYPILVILSRRIPEKYAILAQNNRLNEVISKVRQNLAEKRLLMSWKW